MLEILKKLFCQHKWEQTYTYTSMKDMFSGPDRSGMIYIGQKCALCQKGRTRIQVYGTDGKLDKDYFRDDRNG